MSLDQLKQEVQQLDGEHLRLAVAQEVFEHEVFHKKVKGHLQWWVHDSGKRFPLPLYTHQTGLYTVLDYLIKSGWHWRITSPFSPQEPWFAGLTPIGVSGFNGRPDFEAWGSTLGNAVCRAAVLCVRVLKQRTRPSQAGSVCQQG